MSVGEPSWHIVGKRQRMLRTQRRAAAERDLLDDDAGRRPQPDLVRSQPRRVADNEHQELRRICGHSPLQHRAACNGRWAEPRRRRDSNPAAVAENTILPRLLVLNAERCGGAVSRSDLILGDFHS